MSTGIRLWSLALALTVAAAALLSRIVSPTAALSMLAGCALGAGSFATVALRVRVAFARSAGQPPSALARLLGRGLVATYYLLLAGSLFLLLSVWHASALWLAAGLTWALIIFAMHMATTGRTRPTRPTVPER